MFAYTKIMQGIQAVSAAVTDAYFNLVTLLLPGNGTNGAQNNTFLDSSSNNFTITRNGGNPGMTQGTFSPFSLQPGGWSNYLASSGRLAFGINSAFDITQGDFTVEAWVNISSYSAAQHIAWYRNDSPQSGWGFRISITTGYLQFFYTGGSVVTSTSAVPLNSWVHVAACRSGGTCYLFINGTQVGSAAFSNGTTQSSYSFRIGADGAGTENLIGYISNFRLVKSGALYTSSFTPSTTPLTTTVSAGTVSLLTCQSNRFVDNSSNAFAITLEGTTTSVQAFSPFAPTAAYSAATNGGSGYFDGTGDYLTVASTNAILPTGTQDYSVEAWVYWGTQTTSYPQIVANPANDGFQLLYDVANGYLAVGKFNTGVIITYTIAQTALANQWTHIVATRSGNTHRLFVNGVLRANGTNTISFAALTTQSIGSASTANYYVGYMAGLRTTLGSIPTTYQTSSTTNGTSIFTPPTAPPTTTSEGASSPAFLLNYTNAGITDATAKNDLETVGNAQISTTQSKFGGSSIAVTGGTANYLVSPNINMYTLYGAFTVEAWVYRNTSTSRLILIEGRTAGGYANYLIGILANGTLEFVTSNSGNYYNPTISITNGQWVHVALVRNSSNVVTLYVNGTAASTTVTISGVLTPAASSVWIGAQKDPQYSDGYIDDMRISQFARYTSNFTPPTAAFPVQ